MTIITPGEKGDTTRQTRGDPFYNTTHNVGVHNNNDSTNLEDAEIGRKGDAVHQTTSTQFKRVDVLTLLEFNSIGGTTALPTM